MPEKQSKGTKVIHKITLEYYLLSVFEKFDRRKKFCFHFSNLFKIINIANMARLSAAAQFFMDDPEPPGTMMDEDTESQGFDGPR